MSANAPSSFWVVIEDHEAKVFAVVGPLEADVEWTDRVARARQQGRDVTMCTVSSEVDANLITRELGFRGFRKSEVAIL